MNNQRKDFEDWISSEIDYLNEKATQLFLGKHDGSYLRSELQYKWEAWQAAQKQQWKKPSNELPDAGRDIMIRTKGKHARAGGSTQHEIYCLWINKDGGSEFRNQSTLAKLSDSQVVLAWCYAPVFGGE